MTNEEYREILIKYLRAKAEVQDWHAVADVSMDLRELDVIIKSLKPQSKPR